MSKSRKETAPAAIKKRNAPAGWITGWLASWQAGKFTDWLAGRLAARFQSLYKNRIRSL